METLDSSDTVNGMESSTRTRLLNQVVSFPLRNGRCIDDSGSASTQIHSLFPTHVRGRPQNSTFVVVMQNRPHQSALFFRPGGGGGYLFFFGRFPFPVAPEILRKSELAWMDDILVDVLFSWPQVAQEDQKTFTDLVRMLIGRCGSDVEKARCVLSRLLKMYLRPRPRDTATFPWRRLVNR